MKNERDAGVAEGDEDEEHEGPVAAAAATSGPAAAAAAVEGQRPQSSRPPSHPLDKMPAAVRHALEKEPQSAGGGRAFLRSTFPPTAVTNTVLASPGGGAGTHAAFTPQHAPVRQSSRATTASSTPSHAGGGGGGGGGVTTQATPFSPSRAAPATPARVLEPTVLQSVRFAVRVVRCDAGGASSSAARAQSSLEFVHQAGNSVLFRALCGEMLARVAL